jgi:hypothetical protein
LVAFARTHHPLVVFERKPTDQLRAFLEIHRHESRKPQPGAGRRSYPIIGGTNGTKAAVMTDDQTQQKYAVLPPVAPPGKAYFPGELANGLLPGQKETLTIQFAAPPAPPPFE